MHRSTAEDFRRPVLYVEDHPINVMLMGALFEQRPDLRLVVATTGEQAREVARGLSPALVLLDLNLPDCHGSALLTELRRVPGCETPTAIAVTADTSFDIGGTGFAELWPKPMNLALVLQRLASLLPTDVARRAEPAREAARAA